jgi:hypothetical protein
MKFYEVHYPYYALLKANDKEEAMQLYTECVADDDGSLHEEIKEVERDYALIKFSRGKTEDRKEVPVLEILNDFQSNESMVLLIDGALM